MGTIQTMKNRERWKADIFTRQRFRQHNRDMLKEGQSGRNAEASLAQERLGRDFSRAEAGMWHNYISKGGNKPNIGGGPGMGGGPGGPGEVPELNLPEYDDRKVSALQHKRAAPNIRKLRNVTQQALSTTHENPNVQKMTVRDALAGYGTGLENVMAGAHSEATREYGQQYAASVGAEMTRFNAANQRWSQMYDTSSRAWLMEKDYQLQDQYSDDQDPYDAFEEFYG